MSTPIPLRIYLIRHGETKWSLSGRHTGSTDIPLTKNGERESQQLGHRIQTIKFSRIICSPLQRALRTCEGMHTYEILKARSDWDIFRDGCPGGETPRQVSARADRLIARLRPLSGNVALFTHGQFGSVLAMRWIGLPVADGEHFPLGTGSISILTYAAHHPEVPVMARWNAPGGTSVDIGIYPRYVPITATKPVGIERWENEGGEIPAPKHKASDLLREVTM